MAEYRHLQKMNQSLLKQILKSPKAFLDTQERFAQQLENEANGIVEKIAPHFVFGKLVDFMLTEDGELEEVFYIMKNAKKPSDTIVEIIDMLFNDYADSGLLEEHQGKILECAGRVGYGGSWKPETVFGKILDAGSTYWETLKESANKIIVSEEEYNKAVICCAALKSDEVTKQYLVPSKNGDIEVIKKPIFEFTFKGVDMKGEGDLYTVHHHRKKIFPLDIKTMSGSVTEFPSNFWKYRYDFQGTFYDKGIRQLPYVQELLAKGYTIEPFKFLVIDKEAQSAPLVYSMSHDVSKIGAMGGTLSNGKKLEGIVQAVERYKFHSDSNKWDYPMEYYMNGEMSLEL